MTAITCPRCNEPFASPSIRARHYNGDYSCSDPRTDLRWRVDGDGNWTDRPEIRPTYPALGCYDDQQQVSFD